VSFGDPVSVLFEVAQDESGYPPATTETLWCVPTKSGTYVVDNIPFFVREISLGDEIEVVKKNEVLQFSRLVKKSRNSTVRVSLRNAR